MNDVIKITKITGTNDYQITEHKALCSKYIEVEFVYSEEDKYKCYIPTTDRRINVNFEVTNPVSDSLKKYLEELYGLLTKEKREAWKVAHPIEKPTQRKGKLLTVLYDFKLHTRDECTNEDPNMQKTLQNLRDSGYTIPTIMISGKGNYQLVPLPLNMNAPQNETMSFEFVSRVINLLKEKDAYENKKGHSLLPDHKFPEIRWDSNVAETNNVDITLELAEEKFQLLTTQRNEQKREACKKCFSSGKRQYPFGIKFYYEGEEKWNESIPTVGLAAKEGCKGCGWYDIQKWRKELNKKIKDE